MHSLLSTLSVSGYSGTLLGLVVHPRPVPLFKEEELRIVSAPVALALAQAGSRERVFFSLPNLAAPYRGERTEGSLFFRDPYLHLVLTDHSSIAKTDTAGGDDDKDPRDTKGMTLWVEKPAQAASLSTAEIPRWGPFEKVHVSLHVRQTLALSAHPLVVPAAGTEVPLQSTESVSAPAPSSLTAPQRLGDSTEDLRRQIRELTNSNLELRERLKDQTQQVEALKGELTRALRELEKTNPKGQPRRKSPTP